MKRLYLLLAVVILINLFPIAIPASAIDSNDDALYLVDERFMVREAPDGIAYPSSWDLDMSGGAVKGGMKLVDSSSTAPVSVSRQFIPVTSGIVTAEITFIFENSSNTNGISFNLNSGDTPAVTIVSANNNNLYLQSGGTLHQIGTFWTSGSWHTIKIVANLDTQTVDVYMAGNRTVQNKPFTNSVSSLDGVKLGTGDQSVCTMYLRACRIYTNYYVNERFLTAAKNISLPSNWQSSGKNNGASVEQMDSADGRDLMSARLQDASGSNSVYASIDFTPKPNRDYVWDFSFLIPQKVDGMRMELINSQNSSGMTFITQNGNLCYLGSGGTPVVLVSNYVANLWYRIRATLRPNPKTADFYVNGRLVAQGVSVPSLQTTMNRVSFSTPAQGTGTMWFDDVLVYPCPAEPQDYVPTPVPVQKEAGAPIIGMQTCSLWREGDQWGWDRINPFRERKPLLGFYDEGNPETADWEIKFLLEHGVEFMSFCWFRAAQNAPVKRGTHDAQLMDGFMYAKYSNMFKYMIMWENGNDAGVSGVDDFVNHVLPFWVEYLFKDPRYLKIDNKPVLGIFSYNNFSAQLGNVSNGLNLIRQACINAGFDGAYIILSTTSTSQSNLTGYKNDGFDAVFPYSWGDLSGVKSVQQTNLSAQQKYMDTIPTLTFGRDNRAWYTETGQIASPSEFASTAKWIKNVFLQQNKSTIPNSIASKIMLVGNWNEFGEGHYVMPTSLAGFAYLEALRNLVTSSPHTDVVPTAEQKLRINQLYPRGRTLTPRPYITPAPVPLTDTRRWDFTTGTESWSGSSSTVNAVGGNLEVTGYRGGTTRRIQSPDNLNISASSVPFIKIRLKNENNNASGVIYFSTNAETTMDENKRVNVMYIASDSGFTEYLFDMRSHPRWTGTIKRIRFDLPSGTNKISIDYVALVDDALISAGDNLIPDWSFEGGTLPSGAVNCDMEISSMEFAPGSFKSLKVTKALNTGAVYYDLPGVVNNKPFYYAAQIKVPFDTTPNSDAALTLALSYKVGAQEKTVYLETSGNLLPEAWRKVSAVHTIKEPSEVSDVKLVFTTNSLTAVNTYFLTYVEARPIVTGATTIPADGATDVDVNTEISVTMPSALALNAASLQNASITINGTTANAALNGDQKIVITPAAALQRGRTYSVVAENLVTSSGLRLPNIVFNFTTEPDPSSQQFYVNYGSPSQKEITNTGLEPGRVTAVTTLTISDPADKSAYSIIALYDRGQLEKVLFSPIVLKAGQPNEVIAEVDVPAREGSSFTVKHFVWDTLTVPGAPRLPAAVLSEISGD